MIKRFFQWLGGLLASIWNTFVSALQDFGAWLWEMLKALFGYISEALTNWTLQLITFIIEHIPGVDFGDSANIISTVRENFQEWNNILPLQETIVCVGIYLAAYLVALGIRVCVFIYDKVAALVP